MKWRCLFFFTCTIRTTHAINTIHSIIINRTMRLLPLWKESLNRDGKIHQYMYQQNKQLPMILTELTEHKLTQRNMTLEIQVLVWNRNKDVSELNCALNKQYSAFYNYLMKRKGRYWFGSRIHVVMVTLLVDETKLQRKFTDNRLLLAVNVCINICTGTLTIMSVRGSIYS